MKNDTVPESITPKDPRSLEVLFIIPETRQYEYLGVASLSASLQSNGVVTKIIQLNPGESAKELESILKNSEKLEMIGISWLYSFSENSVIKILKLVKRIRPGIKSVIGGHPPSLNYDSILRKYPEIDYILRGEGDVGIVGLWNFHKGMDVLSAIAGLSYIDKQGKLIHNELKRIENLDALPFPERSQLDEVIKARNHELLISVMGSRGCYGACNFCSMVSFYGCGKTRMKWIGRSPENILDEIQFLISNFGVNTFWFIDDEFIGPPAKGRDRIVRFAELILENKLVFEYGFDARADGVASLSDDDLRLLKKSGLRMISIGIESGSQKVLDRMNKHLDVKLNWLAIEKLILNKINYRYGFIMYDPETTFEDIKLNIRFLEFAMPFKICNTGSFRLLNSLFPHPGTVFTKNIQGNTKHEMNSDLINFPEYSEGELGYNFMLPDVSKYRRLLHLFARKVVEPGMEQKPVESKSIWYGVNDLPQNIAAMNSFLQCHKWLLTNFKDGNSDDFYLSGMQNVFNNNPQY